jgi:hypothetical protein
MRYDVYCAFCGAGLFTPHSTDGMDDQLVTLQDMRWMGEVQVMGKNTPTSSLRK